MAVISISVPDELLAALDRLQRAQKYSGRSDILRAAARTLLAEHQTRATLKGTVDGALLVIHNHTKSEEFMRLHHKYERLVTTQVHNHLESGKCLEILVVHGDAPHIQRMADEFQSSKAMETVKLVTS